MKKLNGSTLKALDDKLFDYNQIDFLIAKRKLELQDRDHADINVGGSRSSKISRPVEDLVILWASDIRIRNLELFRETVLELLKNLNQEQMDVRRRVTVFHLGRNSREIKLFETEYIS